MSNLKEDEIKPFPFFGYAPGNYMNHCVVCEKQMSKVDKLCFVCLECAIKASIKNPATPATPSMQWVKASERLPEFSDKLIWRFSDKSAIDMGYTPKGFKFMGRHFLRNDDETKSIEWLSENPAPIPVKEDESGTTKIGANGVSINLDGIL